ncbi:hypothetical protein DEJ51_30380 [Streptomyces venezuelae]|uniref:Uncharacterized protein n=1 Tax=Streptomyces venezuelae TaxID=54571 RepID=A0A5P2DTS0_STRVZ|nr:hypothetical protein [Streptomyces venezuelae]QES57930.1 hypothetical protein DEJ51_30380 [Streptomyces venezuelae]
MTTLLLNIWTYRATNAAERWLADTPGDAVTSADAQSRTLYIHVRTPGDLYPIKDLLGDLGRGMTFRRDTASPGRDGAG